MRKNIASSNSGVQASVGKFLVNRLIPNHYVDGVGPFVFLDHLYPYTQKPGTAKKPTGDFAHPHRGIATFSYVFSGELEHYDSRGHHDVVAAGGAQWMKAGNGIVHDEQVSAHLQETGGTLHSLQFWINLPAANKKETPAYRGLQPGEVPEVALPGNAGTLRVLIGEYEGKASPIEMYSGQFNYHVKLQPGASATIAIKAGWESAAFVPTHEVVINGEAFKNSELISFNDEGTEITLENRGTEVADILLFGGERYEEPIFAEGPFVMNSRQEIAQAYADFFNQQYGEIVY